MYSPLSGRYADAMTNGVAITATATLHNLLTDATTDLAVVDGAVTDDCTSNIRRSLSLTLPGEQDAFSSLDTQGGEIAVAHVLKYADGSTETIPQGVFIVDQEQLDYSPSGQITMTCPDRWLKVQRNRFGTSRASVPTNAAWQEIKRLVEGAWPGSTFPFPGWSEIDETATTKVGSLTWDDGDRESAILSLCQANSLEVFFDRQGMAVLRKIPVLTPTSTPAWQVNAGAAGVMVSADRTRDRSGLRNVIIASTSATDVYFAPVVKAITDTGDPTCITGPLGYVPEDWSSPSLRNSDQAAAAAVTRLRQRAGAAQTVSLSAIPNPALDSRDVISVQYPQIDPNTPPVVELHILDSLTQPLLAFKNPQDMVTRSTRPLTDGA